MKILVIAHGHPDINVGGGEKAAYILFNQFRNMPDSEAYFLARSGNVSDTRGSFISSYPGRKNEYFIHTSMADYFHMSSAKPETIAAFANFLETIKPDVVHFHHYIHLGVELIQVVKKVCPNAKLVLTIHEYLAMCHRDGQMIKAGSNKLCYESNALDCSMCFPDHPPPHFFLRETYIKHFLLMADAFVVPSKFLMQRYLQWGLPGNKTVFFPYGTELERLKSDATQSENAESSACNVFGFFGQINNYKGLDVLISSIDLMSKAERRSIQLEIFGNLSEGLSPERREMIEAAFEKYKSTIRFNGPYQSVDLARLIRRVDWVVVPSIWWENAPLVIDEAFASGKPVLCSNIGGMAEKIRDGVDGVHFDVGNHRALSRKILEISADMPLYRRLKSNIAPPFDVSFIAKRHLNLYLAIGKNDAPLSGFGMERQSDYSAIT